MYTECPSYDVPEHDVIESLYLPRHRVTADTLRDTKKGTLCTCTGFITCSLSMPPTWQFYLPDISVQYKLCLSMLLHWFFTCPLMSRNQCWPKTCGHPGQVNNLTPVRTDIMSNFFWLSTGLIKFFEGTSPKCG